MTLKTNARTIIAKIQNAEALSTQTSAINELLTGIQSHVSDVEEAQKVARSLSELKRKRDKLRQKVNTAVDTTDANVLQQELDEAQQEVDDAEDIEKELVKMRQSMRSILSNTKPLVYALEKIIRT